MNEARQAWLGIGANLGDARAAVEQAIARIATLPGCRLQAASSLYRTAPVDAGGDDYVNAVVRIATTLRPEELLTRLMEVEQAFGRERAYRNAPRTLDLDILLFEGVQQEDETLTLPHARMHLRAFVLRPLAEIDPGLVIPGQGKVDDLLAATAGQVIARLD